MNQGVFFPSCSCVFCDCDDITHKSSSTVQLVQYTWQRLRFGAGGYTSAFYGCLKPWFRDNIEGNIRQRF